MATLSGSQGVNGHLLLARRTLKKENLASCSVHRKAFIGSYKGGALLLKPSWHE